jgi:cysteine-rich repeat protein
VTTREEKTCAGLCKLGVCQAPICGDAKIEAGEDCDDPDATASGACLNCKRGSCGDGVVWAANGEQCDDGNKASGDGCSATCRDEPVELALGDEFSCARSGTGLIKCWGDNSSGQLGLGDTDSRGGDPATVPSRLSAIDLGTGLKAKSISAHGRSVCARLESGDVKCWGNNGSGQLGTGDKFDRGVKPKQMGVELSPIPLGDGLKAIGISSGGDHTCAVLSSGAVKCWGLNAYGQLGQGNPAADASIPMPVTLQRPVTAVSASSFVGSGRGGNRGGATCALLNNAMVQCWGYTQVVPHTSLTDADGSSGIGDYPDEMSSLVTFAFADSPVKSIVAGNLSAAILADGSLRLWGWAPSPIDKDLPVTLADPASAPAVQMGGKVTAIAVSESHACAILEGGDLKCWGSNNYGALGLGATLSTDVAATPKDLASVDLDGRGAWQVATSVNHTCAILKDGTLKCWGYNGHGQLGLGDTTSRGNTGTKLSVDAVSLSF